MSADVKTEPEQWVDRHGDGLYRYAFLRLRSPDLAADMVQETFVEATRLLTACPRLWPGNRSDGLRSVERSFSEVRIGVSRRAALFTKFIDEVADSVERPLTGSSGTSALSQLNLRVDGLQFGAGVVDFHLPVDAALDAVHVR
jgi:hypothetical protein